MSGKARSGASDGRISDGDKVEVLSSEDGFSDAWATAVVVGPSKGGWLVEYSKFVDGDGKLLREKVRMRAVRFKAPQAAIGAAFAHVWSRGLELVGGWVGLRPWEAEMTVSSSKVAPRGREFRARGWIAPMHDTPGGQRVRPPLRVALARCAVGRAAREAWKRRVETAHPIRRREHLISAHRERRCRSIGCATCHSSRTRSTSSAACASRASRIAVSWPAAAECARTANLSRSWLLL